MFQHHPEKFFFIRTALKVFTVSEHFASLDDGRGKDAYAPADDGKKFRYGTLGLGCDD